MKLKEWRRAFAWGVLLYTPTAISDRFCEAEWFVRWLEPRGWFGI